MSIGASATVTRASAVWYYADVILILVIAVPALALGAPPLGYLVAAGAWALSRVGATAAEKAIAGMTEFRRQIGYGVASSMVRVWMLAGTIVLCAVIGERSDGLTAALVIFGAFSIYFVRSAIGQLTRRSSTR